MFQVNHGLRSLMLEHVQIYFGKLSQRGIEFRLRTGRENCPASFLIKNIMPLTEIFLQPIGVIKVFRFFIGDLRESNLRELIQAFVLE